VSSDSTHETTAQTYITLPGVAHAVQQLKRDPFLFDCTQKGSSAVDKNHDTFTTDGVPSIHT
jgi:hypothetical protein